MGAVETAALARRWRPMAVGRRDCAPGSPRRAGWWSPRPIGAQSL